MKQATAAGAFCVVAVQFFASTFPGPCLLGRPSHSARLDRMSLDVSAASAGVGGKQIRPPRGHPLPTGR